MRVGEHYDSRRAAVTALVAPLGDDALATTVPGCPRWTVRELVSHLTALSHDVVNGVVDGAGTDPWTARQVVERQDVGVPALLAEWERWGPALSGLLGDLGSTGWRIVFDVSLHEDDLREALGLPGSTSATHAVVLEGLVSRVSDRITEHELPPLALVAGSRSWVAGTGEVEATLTVDGVGELSRVLAGRRSSEAVRALVWDGDPAPYLPHLPLSPS